MAAKLVTIIAGVGAGTGSSIAKRFSEVYPVVLLSRKPQNYESLVNEINDKGGKAIGISTDLTDGDSINNAFENMKKEFGNNMALSVSPELHAMLFNLLQQLSHGNIGCYLQCKWSAGPQRIP